MHKQYGDKGLVAVSVSLDDLKDAELRKRADQFLQKQGAAFANFILDAPEEEWQTKMKINGYPCVYVFDRDNRFVLKLTQDVDYKVIEERVRGLLEK
jgi:hypothetical protein